MSEDEYLHEHPIFEKYREVATLYDEMLWHKTIKQSKNAMFELSLKNINEKIKNQELTDLLQAFPYRFMRAIVWRE